MKSPGSDPAAGARCLCGYRYGRHSARPLVIHQPDDQLSFLGFSQHDFLRVLGQNFVRGGFRHAGLDSQPVDSAPIETVVGRAEWTCQPSVSAIFVRCMSLVVALSVDLPLHSVSVANGA